MTFLLIPVAVLLAGLAYQAFGTYLDKRRFPAPGRLVQVGNLRLHLTQQGSGTPVVVLEAGIAGSSIGWALVHSKLASFTTACSYDRAGLGWSGDFTEPRSVEQMTAELRGLLQAATLPPPYILVGHSFGGLLIKAFAALHPEEVAGLVFVDPVSLSSWSDAPEAESRRLSRGVALSRRGKFLARFGIVRGTLAFLASGNRLIPKVVGTAASGSGSVVMNRLVGEVQKLPPELWPVIRSHWSNPKCFKGMAAHLECLPRSAKQVLVMKIPAGIPVTILSAATATTAELAERESWARESQQGRHIQVPATGHWLQLERPELVIDAVREMVSFAIDGRQ